MAKNTLNKIETVKIHNLIKLANYLFLKELKWNNKSFTYDLIISDINDKETKCKLSETGRVKSIKRRIK